MNNDNTLIPNYRFPEFKNDGSWNKLKVEEIIMNESSSLSINKLEFLDNGYKLFGADGLVGYIDSYKQKDDYIAIVKDGSGAGRLSYYPAYSSVVGTLTYLKIKDKKLNDLKFQYYNLHNIDFKNHIKGGGIPHIYYSDYKNDLIGNPTNPSEQQKIAACLSSLDDVIAGHEEKLTLLEEHKKGLMQNLFPQEGETQPKYRFPEFENDGDWVEKKVSHVFSFFQGYAFSSNDATASGTRWLKIADVSFQQMNSENPTFLPKAFKELHARFLVKKGGVVIALTRPILNGKLKISKVDDEFNGSLLNQRVAKLETSYNLDFVYYLLQLQSFIKEIENKIAGNEPPNLSYSQIQDINILITNKPSEQQKIASVLSSIDDLIIAQREKIEALKTHKKGLMQGLFPKIES